MVYIPAGMCILASIWMGVQWYRMDKAMMSKK